VVDGNVNALINDDLSNILAWANKWLINFSPSKTEMLTVSNKPLRQVNQTIKLGNVPVNEVETHKHLGIILNRNLDFSSHINSLTSNATRKLDIMKKLKYKLDRKSLEMIYFGFVRPSLEYGDLLFAGAPDCHLAKLDKLQYLAMLYVTGARAKTSTDKLLKELEWQMLSDRRDIHSLILLYKIIQGNGPTYLSVLLNDYNYPLHRYELRANDGMQFRIPPAKIRSFRMSFFIRTMRQWNNLEINIKLQPSLELFKSKLSKPKNTKHKKLYNFGDRKSAVMHA
jgi:hypothetical protein